MYGTAEVLTALEECERKAFWMRTWERTKLDGNQTLQQALRAGLLSQRADFGEAAGEECYGLGVTPGLDTAHYDVHAEVCHLACLADVVTTALRKAGEPPWRVPEPHQFWKPSCFLSPDGEHLRRIVLVSSWNDDRHYQECRSWPSLGAVCAYGLPMQQAVIVLGAYRNGKRHSPWTKGLRHPMNKQLRFRKKTEVQTPFKETWRPVWREDFDDISTHDWLQAMLQDGVLQDLCFKVEIAVPEKAAREQILEMAKRKLDRLAAIEKLPDPQFVNCNWPKPCLFRTPCHAGREPQGGAFRILVSNP